MYIYMSIYIYMCYFFMFFFSAHLVIPISTVGPSPTEACTGQSRMHHCWEGGQKNLIIGIHHGEDRHQSTQNHLTWSHVSSKVSLEPK